MRIAYQGNRARIARRGTAIQSERDDCAVLELRRSVCPVEAADDARHSAVENSIGGSIHRNYTCCSSTTAGRCRVRLQCRTLLALPARSSRT